MIAANQVHIVVGVVTAALLATASPAVAQRLERPPRSVDGLFGGRRVVDPNRTSQELSLTIDLLGGYDDNVTPAGEDAPSPFVPQQSSYVGTASTALRYRRGNTRRSVAMSGEVYVNSYSRLELGPQVGGDAAIDASTNLGERTLLTGNAGALYQPTFLIGAFGSIPGETENGVIPDAGGMGGLSEQRWLQTQASAGLERSWTMRQRTAISYTFSDRQPTGGAALLETRARGVTLRHTWRVARSASLNVGYEHANDSSEQPTGPAIPFRSHNVQAGVDFTRRLSSTRTWGVGLGAGVTEAQTLVGVGMVPAEDTSPTFYGSLRADLGRTWAVSANARRDLTRLHDLTPQTFLATVGSMNVGGTIVGPLQVGLAAAYSEGVARDRETGSYQIFAGTMQLQYAVSRCCDLFGSYAYYQHRVLDVAAVPVGFPSAYDRNAVRVGLSILLPLHGTFQVE